MPAMSVSAKSTRRVVIKGSAIRIARPIEKVVLEYCNRLLRHDRGREALMHSLFAFAAYLLAVGLVAQHAMEAARQVFRIVGIHEMAAAGVLDQFGKRAVSRLYDGNT